MNCPCGVVIFSPVGATRQVARERGNHHALGVIPPTLIKRAFP
jgi:hypothetical protein